MALWPLPDYTTLRQAILDTIRQVRTALGTAPDTGPGSDADIDATTLATIESRLHRYIRLGVAMLFPQSASGEGSKGWATETGCPDGQGGYGPILPDVASATSGLAVTATGITVDIQNYTLLDEAGLQYKVNESYAFAGAGTTNLNVISVDTGLATNLPVGSALTFETPAVNCNADASVVVELEGGVDAEEDPDINARVLDRLQNPSLSGNVAHWRRWIEETDEGVFDGYVYPLRYGAGILGTVDYAATLRHFHRWDRLISGTQLSAITAHVEAEAPISLMNNSRQLTLAVQRVDAVCEIELHPDAAASSSPDFDSHTLNTTIAAWTVAGAWAGWIRATHAIDAVITAGDFVIIAGARAEVAAVGAASTGGANTDFDVVTSFETYDATINPWPWSAAYDPTVTPDRLCSGGGVIETAWAAAVTYFDTIGPARGAYAGEDTTDWDDTYRYKLLQSYVQRSHGDILDTTVQAAGGGAAVDVTPTDPLDATNLLLVPNDLAIEVVP